jgi:hypothetical protein|eukprot:COSAG02_NODE_6507_length_3531_cov_1.989219_6_plen_51_part_00
MVSTAPQRRRRLPLADWLAGGAWGAGKARAERVVKDDRPDQMSRPGRGVI